MRARRFAPPRGSRRYAPSVHRKLVSRSCFCGWVQEPVVIRDASHVRSRSPSSQREDCRLAVARRPAPGWIQGVDMRPVSIHRRSRVRFTARRNAYARLPRFSPIMIHAGGKETPRNCRPLAPVFPTRRHAPRTDSFDATTLVRESLGVWDSYFSMEGMYNGYE